ncbi:MAG: glycosyltransferase [Ruminococcaceae bacterium]|nr:glycosyltransferase [Oscillospiraceae bacterium]
MSDIKVSVIMPVYNTDNYLTAALESICNQSLKEIEIICINDGSTDNSLNILEVFAQRDARIFVHTQKNEGVSCARNVGIGLAKGRYIYFMDSDDVLAENALSSLFEKAEKEKLDVLYLDADVFFDDVSMKNEAERFNYSRKKEYSGVYTGAALFRLMSNEGEYFATPWSQFFSSEHLKRNAILFHPGVIHEDNAFTFEAILKAKRVSHINQPFFHRRIRENSIMTSKLSFKNAYGYFVSYIDMFRVFTEVESELSEEEKDAALARIGQNLVNAQNIYAALPEDETDFEATLGSYRRFFDRLVVKPGKSYKSAEEWKKTVLKHSQDKEKLKAKLELTKENYETVKNYFESLKVKNKAVTENYEQLKLHHEKLKGYKSAVDGKYESLKNDYSELSEKNKELLAELERITAEYQQLSGKNKSLALDYDRLSEEYNELTETGRRLSENLEEIENIYEKLKSTKGRRFIISCFENGYRYTIKRCLLAFFGRLFKKKR